MTDYQQLLTNDATAIMAARAAPDTAQRAAVLMRFASPARSNLSCELFGFSPGLLAMTGTYGT